MKTEYILINLLPYREKIKKEKLQKFSVIVGGFVAVAIGLIAVAHLNIAVKINEQQLRNEFITKSNQELDKRIKEIADLKEEIRLTLEKRRVVEGLQVNRSDMVNIFNEISSQLVEGLTLKGVKQTGRQILITGYTLSNSKVSKYMNNLEKNGIFTNANLIEIKLLNGTPTSIAKANKNNKNDDSLAYSEFTISIDLSINDDKEKK